jgi:hypothetical protein
LSFSLELGLALLSAFDDLSVFLLLFESLVLLFLDDLDVDLFICAEFLLSMLFEGLGVLSKETGDLKGLIEFLDLDERLLLDDCFGSLVFFSKFQNKSWFSKFFC